MHRDPRRAREQPEERLARRASRQDHGVHGGVRLRKVVDRVRYDRRRSAATAERHLHAVSAEPPAALRAAGRRLDREFIDADRDLAATHRRERTLDRGHHHRHLRAVAPFVFARRQALRGLFERVFVQRSRRNVSGLRGARHSAYARSRQVLRPREVAERRPVPARGVQRERLVSQDLHAVRPLRQRQEAR